MTNRQADMPHHDPTDHDADVIHLDEASRERPRKTDVPVELFLLSPEGQSEMAELFETVDESNEIIRTLGVEIAETFRNRDPNIYSLFIHDDGAEMLTRPELIDLYRGNPLVNATIRAANKSHHRGDFQAQELYTFGLRIFMNMVRYEWLTRTHDATDPIWQDRAFRLGEYHGREIHLNLQPGFRRSTSVPRKSTPSDILRNQD